MRRRFKRRCVAVGDPYQHWQADLVDLSSLKKTYDWTAFLLTVINVFSKRAWCIPLKNKSAVSLVAAFARLLVNKAPTTLQTDKVSEFLNRALQKLLKEYGAHHFATHNEETKASIVERFNRTLKTRMWRYFTNTPSVRYVDVLQDIVRSHNNMIRRTIGMAPSEVNVTNQEETNWTEELFTIVDAHRPEPPVYRLADWHGEGLEGTLYVSELQKVVVSKDKAYMVEEIHHCSNKRMEAFVKWFGWPRPSTVG